MFHLTRRSLTRIATPAVVLASGALLLASPQSDRKAAGKHVDRESNAGRTAGPAGHVEQLRHDAIRAAAVLKKRFRGVPAVSTADWLVQDSPTSPRRPSMVVDPPNGRVPLKREAIEKRDAAACA